MPKPASLTVHTKSGIFVYRGADRDGHARWECFDKNTLERISMPRRFRKKVAQAHQKIRTKKETAHAA